MQDSNRIDREGVDVQEAAGEFQGILRSRQHSLIRRILRIMSLLGVFALVSGVFDLIATGEYFRFLVIAAIYLGLLIATFTS